MPLVLGGEGRGEVGEEEDWRLPYKARSFDHSLPGWKCVARMPKRIVPPSFVGSISGMKIITGSGVLSSSSTEPACGILQTLRAYSITAICMPRQIPR